MSISRAALFTAVSAALGTLYGGVAQAQTEEALRRQVDTLQKEVDELKRNQPAAEPDHDLQQSGLNRTVTAHSSIQIYGHLDLSIDDATKGFKEGDMRADGTAA